MRSDKERSAGLLAKRARDGSDMVEPCQRGDSAIWYGMEVDVRDREGRQCR